MVNLFEGSLLHKLCDLRLIRRIHLWPNAVDVVLSNVVMLDIHSPDFWSAQIHLKNSILTRSNVEQVGAVLVRF